MDILRNIINESKNIFFKLFFISQKFKFTKNIDYIRIVCATDNFHLEWYLEESIVSFETSHTHPRLHLHITDSVCVHPLLKYSPSRQLRPPAMTVHCCCYLAFRLFRLVMALVYNSLQNCVIVVDANSTNKCTHSMQIQRRQ